LREEKRENAIIQNFGTRGSKGEKVKKSRRLREIIPLFRGEKYLREMGPQFGGERGEAFCPRPFVKEKYESVRTSTNRGPGKVGLRRDAGCVGRKGDLGSTILLARGTGEKNLEQTGRGERMKTSMVLL